MNEQKIEGKKDLEKNALSDDQLDQVSGGYISRKTSELEKESENVRSYNPRHRIDSPTPMV